MTVIGLLKVEYRLHGNTSLKDKRRVANSLKQKVRNKFNVSIAEIGSADSMDRLALSIVGISNEASYLQSSLNKCLLMLEAICPEEMVYSNLECLDLDQE